MARTLSVEKLPTQQLLAVQQCIRMHRYQQVDDMLAALDQAGIHLSRSPMYRYVAKLRSLDAMTACGEEGTIVTITERVSGKVMVLKSAASAEAIASLIQNAQVPSTFTG